MKNRPASQHLAAALLFSATALTCVPATTTFAAPVVLDQVPSYEWHHGCSPTAIASILGYWDHKGYDNLFDASGWDEVRRTDAVKEQISSTAHNEKYDSDPDKPNLPEPPDTSIADFLHTSEGDLGFGATYSNNIGPGTVEYAAYRGYDDWQTKSFFMNEAEAASSGGQTFGWGDLINEIDSGRPLHFTVDTLGAGAINHSIPVIGYDDRGADGLWYGAYTDWVEEEEVEWFQFREVSNQYAWGIGEALFIIPGEPTAAVPEPQTYALFAVGLFVAVAAVQRKNRQTGKRVHSFCSVTPALHLLITK